MNHKITKYKNLISVAVLVLLSFFIFSNDTLATSGACSYHGGVNCSAGAAYDGHAICNDGTESPSVYFSQMTECQNNYHYVSTCVYPYSSSCTTENDYGRMSAMWARSGYPETMQANLTECRSSIDNYNAQKAKYDQCVYNLNNPTPYPIPTPRPSPPTPTPLTRQEFIDFQIKSFNEEFTAKVLPVILYDFPAISADDLDTIKKNTFDLAFSAGFQKMSLLDIYEIAVKKYYLQTKEAAKPMATPAPYLEPTQNIFKDLFKNKPTTTPKPKATIASRITPLTASVSATPNVKLTTQIKKQSKITNVILNIFRNIKFW